MVSIVAAIPESIAGDTVKKRALRWRWYSSLGLFYAQNKYVKNNYFFKKYSKKRIKTV